MGATPPTSSPAKGVLLQMVDDRQPRFGLAVVEDARATAAYRRERDRFRNRLDALGQVLRLCWQTEAFFAQCCYRAKVAARLAGIPVVPTVLHHLSVMTGQVVIGDRAVIEPGLYLPHGQVVIDGITVIGAGSVIRPFVTIGLGDGNPIGPDIGPRTKVGTGAKIFGPVKVGADVQIGANAVVTGDIPAGATAVGAPARVVRSS